MELKADGGVLEVVWSRFRCGIGGVALCPRGEGWLGCSCLFVTSLE